MARVSEIFSTATLTPSKDEILAQHFGPVIRVGEFRFVDPKGKVGIETFLVRESADGALLQLPVTYREQRINDKFEIATTEHSELGTRYITKVVADPVAVTEYIRVILEGDTNAERSDGKQPPFQIRGTGTAGVDTLTVGNIHLKEITDTMIVGHVDINEDHKPFSLSLPVQAVDASAEVGLALLAVDAETGQQWVLAELTI